MALYIQSTINACSCCVFSFPGSEMFVLRWFFIFFSCVEKSLRTFWFLNVLHNELEQRRVQFQRFTCTEGRDTGLVWKYHTVMAATTRAGTAPLPRAVFSRGRWCGGNDVKAVTSSRAEHTKTRGDLTQEFPPKGIVWIFSIRDFEERFWTTISYWSVALWTASVWRTVRQQLA